MQSHFENLDDLVARQRDGHTLEQPFYTDPGIFRLDLERLVNRQWLLVDHVSALPEAGHYRTVEVGGESVIVVRSDADNFRAFYNVCRHRGARLCEAGRGRAARITCPYHAWTWSLEGSLVSARRMPEGFDKTLHRLHPCHVEVLDGLVFINLSPGDPPDMERIRRDASPLLQLHGMADARVADRQRYRIAANWKLVLENFFECYHCLPNHPQYCKVNALVKKYGDGSQAAVTEYEDLCRAWEASAAALGYPTGTRGSVGVGTPGANAAGGQSLDEPFWSASRFPIREGFSTQSRDGEPVAPLMGEFTGYDGGETSVTVGCLSFVVACNDYATLFRYAPTGPTETELEIIWLVSGEAEPGKDYDPEEIRWLWHETTLQDQRIIELNQQGVNSAMYRPGPYSTLEANTDQFTRWYLRQLSVAPELPERLMPARATAQGR